MYLSRRRAARGTVTICINIVYHAFSHPRNFFLRDTNDSVIHGEPEKEDNVQKETERFISRDALYFMAQLIGRIAITEFG